MKRIANLIVLQLLFAGFYSCDLTEKIYDTPVADTFIKSQNDVPYLLNGVYERIASNGLLNGSITGMVLYMYAADDMRFGGTGAQGVFSQKKYVSGDGLINSAWATFYQVINNANKLKESIEVSDFNEAYKSRILGELSFIRGWMYFDMVRLFGGVPLRNESVHAGSDFNLPRSTVEETYAIVLDELKRATELCIPYSKMPAAENGHVTKGAAQGLLALAYLTYGNYHDLNGRNSQATGYYSLAKTYADSVILSGEYQLVSDYRDLWDIEKENAAYKEVILGVRKSRNPLDIGGGSRFPTDFMPTTFQGVTGRIAQNRTGEGGVKIMPWFYDKCTTGDFEGDYRSEVSFLTKWIENGVEGKYRITYPNVRESSIPESIETMPNLDKYRDPNGLSSHGHENDLFYLRLAEVYLIKAEAENELNGPTAEAYSAFNKLRERARKANGVVRQLPKDLAPGLTKEQFRMKIFDERGLELVGEAHRRFDLVRMRYTDNKRTMMEYIYGDFIKTIKAGAPTYNATLNVWEGGKTDNLSYYPEWDPKFLLYPIPLSEMDINPGMQGHQNPGW